MTDGAPVGRARAALFAVWAGASLLVMGLFFAPAAAVSRAAAYWAMTAYCRQLFWMMARLCGVRVEIRGAAPTGAAVVAAKHHSYLDVMMMMRFLDRPRFVMKRSLVWMPVVGLYALRIGAAPIDRAKGGRALRRLERRFGAARAEAAQIVIYPEGSRVAPGNRLPYRRGAARLARSFGLPCVPAATNAGVFWPKSGLIARQGVAVVEFLEPLAPPKDAADAGAFMAALEDVVETASGALLTEARRAIAAKSSPDAAAANSPQNRDG